MPDNVLKIVEANSVDNKVDNKEDREDKGKLDKWGNKEAEGQQEQGEEEDDEIEEFDKD